MPMVLALSKVRRCSLTSFRFCYVLQMTSVTLNHLGKVFSFASYVGINGACFASREECVAVIRTLPIMLDTPVTLLETRRDSRSGDWSLTLIGLTLLSICCILEKMLDRNQNILPTKNVEQTSSNMDATRSNIVDPTNALLNNA